MVRNILLTLRGDIETNHCWARAQYSDADVAIACDGDLQDLIGVRASLDYRGSARQLM